MGFSVEEKFLVETVFVGERGTLGEEEVVGGEFSGGELSGKDKLWDRELAFDFMSLSL